jgi:hypothetical protein
MLAEYNGAVNMSTPLERFAFVDATHAAEVLRVSQEQVLDWVAAGRLRAYGGKPGNPFLRSADVANLLAELGVDTEESPKRTRSANARVQQRLTADSRWSELTDADVREWVRRADPTRRQAARTTAMKAIGKLHVLLEALNDATE